MYAATVNISLDCVHLFCYLSFGVAASKRTCHFNSVYFIESETLIIDSKSTNATGQHQTLFYAIQ